MTLTVGSLFSGIGGIDLGLERAGMRVIWQSEIDPYACRVLAKHWPDTPNLGDITRIDWSTVDRPDLICGGYPCQPFSYAGVRRGEHDPRHLWPYFLDAIRALRPRYALLENVPGHLSLGFGRVLGDLAESGYDAEWDCVPAAAVGAPHRRDRVFVVAHANGESESGRTVDAQTQRLVVPHADGERLEGPELQREFKCFSERPRHSSWWAIEPEMGRVADGVPDRMGQLHALGNAVVPQVAEHIGRMILSAFDADTSPADARPTPEHTHHTTVHRCADGDVRPHTCRTAATPDGPSGDRGDLVADHRDRPDGTATRSTDALHARSVDLGDRDGQVEGGGGDAEDDVADLQITNSLVAHALSQPQTTTGVNHK